MKIAIRNYKDRPKQTNIENVCHQENFTKKMEWDDVYVFPALKFFCICELVNICSTLFIVSLLGKFVAKVRCGKKRKSRVIPSKPACSPLKSECTLPV